MIAEGKALLLEYWRAYQERERPQTPAWMTPMLWVAGCYNIFWGTFIVLFPLVLFRWGGLPLPNYPEIWQCVGMIVGVYGLGYIIAAHDPLRQWPIVLVGFLGKFFGPIGMMMGCLQGRIPWIAGLVCVTNDLIWWIPFLLVLHYAYTDFWSKRRAHHATTGSTTTK